MDTLEKEFVNKKKANRFPFDHKDDHRNPILERWRNRCNYLRHGGAKKWASAFFKYMRGVVGNFALLMPLLVLFSVIIVGAMTIRAWIGFTYPIFYTLMSSMVLICGFVFSFIRSEMSSNNSTISTNSKPRFNLGFVICIMPAAVVLDIIPMIIKYLRHKEFLTESFNWDQIIAYAFTFVLVYGTTLIAGLKTLAGTQRKSKLSVQLLSLFTSWLFVVIAVVWMVNRIYYGIPPTNLSLLLPFIAVLALCFSILYRFVPKTWFSFWLALIVALAAALILIRFCMINYSLFIVSQSKQIGELTRPITNIVNAIRDDTEWLKKSLSSDSMKKLDVLIDKRDSLNYSNQLLWKEHFDSDYPIQNRLLERITPFLAENVSKSLLSMSVNSNELQDWSVFTTIRPKYYASAMNYLEVFAAIDQFSQLERQKIRETENLFAANKLVGQIKQAYKDTKTNSSNGDLLANFVRRAERMLLIGQLIDVFYTKDQDIPQALDRDMLDKLESILVDDFSKKDPNEIALSIRKELLRTEEQKRIEVKPIGRKSYFERLVSKMQKDDQDPINKKLLACLNEIVADPRDPMTSKLELLADDKLVIEAFGEFLGILRIREQGDASLSGRIEAITKNACGNINFLKLCTSRSVDAFAVAGDRGNFWDVLIEKSDGFLAAVLGSCWLIELDAKNVYPTEEREKNSPKKLRDRILFDNVKLTQFERSDEFLLGLKNRSKQDRLRVSSICEFILTHRGIGGKMEADPAEDRATLVFGELFLPTIPNSKKLTDLNAHINERAMILFQRDFSDQKAISIGAKERLLLLTMCDPFATRSDRLIRRLFCGRYADLVNNQRLVDRLAMSMLGPNLITVVSPAIILLVFGAIFVNPNLTSLHEFYKDSLVQAFFISKPNPKSGFHYMSDSTDIKVSELCSYDHGSTAPFALINATLNAPGSQDERLRDRNAYLFSFTPLHMGAVLSKRNEKGVIETQDSFIRMIDYEHFDKGFTLGSAMTISAGAAAPNMGRYSNWMFRLAMLFLNVRLGYWIWKPVRIPTKEGDRVSSFGLHEIVQNEKDLLKKRRSNAQCGCIDRGSIGLALSGGGIRSAAFNLGIAQCTDSANFWDYFDYLSTVSGGGYIGCSIQTLLSNSNESVDAKVEAGSSNQTQISDDTAKMSNSTGEGQESTVRKVNDSKVVVNDADSLFDRLFFNRKYFCIFSEAFALMDTTHGWWNLSDGGHIENLGVYSLLLRHCKIIVVGDGEDDHRGIFDGLTRMLLLAQNDLGVRVEFPDGELDRLRGDDGFAKSHFTVGKITYSDQTEGNETAWLLYLRASVTGDEDTIISNYRKVNDRFPNESTADQFFDEHQFEAYRLLGLHIGRVAFEAVFKGCSINDSEGMDPCIVLSGYLENYFNKLKSGVGGDDRFMVPSRTF
jgi:hypothetical protein